MNQLYPGPTVIIESGAFVWVVGKWLPGGGDENWRLQGIFSQEEDAITACDLFNEPDTFVASFVFDRLDPRNLTHLRDHHKGGPC